MNVTSDGTPLSVPKIADDEIQQLQDILHGNSLPRLISPEGEEIVLSETLFKLLRQVIAHLAQGEAISLIPANKAMNEVQAADILNVPLGFYRKLLDQGEIPYHHVGSLRKVTFADLMDYKRERDIREREALREITRLGQEIQGE